ncbi:hypothetical protein KP509_24G071800 [Ceratopteris richardii]|nr:hypothetical protein KP509_24G071800 [Ceratopteris richardii]
MASSLNGLKVGDTFSGGPKATTPTFDPLGSPGLTETGGISKSLSSYPSNGDELSSLDSYMSDDSDNDSVCYRTGRICYRTPQRILSSLGDSSRAASPVKSSKGVSSFCSNAATNGFSMSSTSISCMQPRQRVADAESPFPPSPSDPCYSADLRRTALLKSLQLRAQSPVATSDVAAADENINDCPDSCEHHLNEADDRFSPFTPNMDDLSAEQAGCNHDIMGSPVHGTYPGQTERGSGRVRSLLLDACTVIKVKGCSDVRQEGDVSDSTEADNASEMK